MDKLFLSEHRCKCGKLLFKGMLFDGTLEIKCRGCGEINSVGQIKLLDDKNHYLLIINENGIIFNVSESAGNILGYANGELLGKRLNQVDHAFPKEVGEKIFSQNTNLSVDTFFKWDTAHLTKRGEKVPVSVKLKLYRPSEKDKYILLSAEPKTTEHKVNAFNGDLPKFIDNACDFTFCIDKNGLIECVSQPLENFFGFTAQAVMGSNYFESIPIKIVVEEKNKFAYFSDKGEPYWTVHDGKIGANGKALYTELYFTPKFNDLENFIGYRILGWIVKNS